MLNGSTEHLKKEENTGMWMGANQQTIHRPIATAQGEKIENPPLRFLDEVSVMFA